MEAPKKPPLSDLQRAFLQQRIAHLEHQLRLLKMGKVGIRQVTLELRDELTTHKLSLGYDNVDRPSEKKPALLGPDGKPLQT